MTTSPASPRDAKPGRRARGSISRAQIVEAAHRILARSPSDQVTVRSLAAELHAAPMSLYRHMDSKDDVLDEVVDELLARVRPPRVRESDWRRYLTSAADAFRAFLVEQPAALHVYLRHPVSSPAALARMEAMLRAFRSAGCSARQAERAYASVHTYTIGFAALEANRAEYVAASDSTEIDTRLAGFTTARQFRAGLDYLLDGIAADTRT
ncbi:TetR/AcrR family transcriptional regulator [Jatrophihabitans endophyticus]|uniref:TetR/AcrR family transcriptional regulator n=1 Tax=Jatrophihabitans endophyticus TaxID=1206085 RepID=UPI001A04E05C|nr:TetR/AcrR family transcriptional regulator [Jatrophihabitans endophyticus]MBE7190779.1 TetR/AcrR family transcriptional regulator C-terminal domain-containing protein [Jatrophihabitans endophyticus]